MKTQMTNLTDFTTNSGVTETVATYKYTSPGLVVGSGDYIYHDDGAMTNFATTCWVQFGATTAQFRVLLGVTAAGAGKALDFNLTASSQTVSLTNISTFTGVADSTIVSKEMIDRLTLTSGKWYYLTIIISNNILKVYFGNYYMFETNVYAPGDTYWGFSGMATANSTVVSDVWWYNNQVFYGNVNINGVPDVDGVAVMFKQVDGAVVDYVQCNTDGEYAILVTDDPTSGNKYFLIGYIQDEPTVQPRGVGNITL